MGTYQLWGWGYIWGYDPYKKGEIFLQLPIFFWPFTRVTPFITGRCPPCMIHCCFRHARDLGPTFQLVHRVGREHLQPHRWLIASQAILLTRSVLNYCTWKIEIFTLAWTTTILIYPKKTRDYLKWELTYIPPWEKENHLQNDSKLTLRGDMLVPGRVNTQLQKNFHLYTIH